MSQVKKTKWLLVGATIIVALLGLIIWAKKPIISSYLIERQYRENIPAPIDYGVINRVVDDSGKITEIEVKNVVKDINLAVPFAPQAPFANWDQPYQDACEEATLIMVERYLRGESLSLAQMDAEILTMVDFQNEKYGFFMDSNAKETTRLANDYFPNLVTQVFYNITAEDIRDQLRLGNPVVVLVDGRKLGNPFYVQPGPDKHSLVIKGFIDGKFITNDPGTRRGADLVYGVSTLMNSLVDYDGDTPGTHDKAMIIVKKRN